MRPANGMINRLKPAAHRAGMVLIIAGIGILLIIGEALQV